MLHDKLGVWVLIVGLLMTIAGVGLAGKRVVFLYRLISSGQPAPDRVAGVTGRLGLALKTQVVEVFGQKKLLKWSIPGTAHFFVFWAFLILGTVYFEAFMVLFTRNPEWHWLVFGKWGVLGFIQDFIAVMCLLGIIAFWQIRVRNAPAKLGRDSRFSGSHLGGAYLVLFMIFNVLWSLFLFRGAVEARDMAISGHQGYRGWAFVSYGLGKVLPDSNLLIAIGLLLHLGIMLVFLVDVVNSKHLHIFVAPINVLFGRRPVALGAVKPLISAGKPITLDDVDDLDEDAKLGIGSIEDFTWKGLLDMATCTECGRCQSQCPAWNTEKPLSPKMLILNLRDHAFATGDYILADEATRATMLENDEALAKEVARPLIGDEASYGVIDPDVLWSCVNCGACVNQCPVDIEHVDHIVDMRRYQVLVEDNFPAELNGLFKGMESRGNPWNMSASARLDWAKDLPFDVKVVGESIESLEEVDWLFWVGCAGAYEDRAKKTTRAVAELLDIAGVSFGVLGNGETCTGDSARRAGNEFLFQGLAQQNVETFKEFKVKKVVSTCAHCFNTLKNEYKDFGIELEVVHHTQLLNRLVREGKLTPVAEGAGAQKRSITYHDPCFIGRHNGVYTPPRELLEILPGAEFVEMPRNSERSFCCGAGGARMWMEENIGTRINQNRANEAVDTGADQIAVGCPFCRVMLSDGLTSAQQDGRAREEVEVLDVAQMLLASVKGEQATKLAPGQGAKVGASAKAGSEAHAGTSGGVDVATKAEPEAGDVTITDDTVTETADAGPAAKASGGSSLFDSPGSMFDEPQAKAAPATADPDKTPAEEAKAAKPAASGGSLFDDSSSLFDSPAAPKPASTETAPTEAKSETEAAPAQAEPSAELGAGGSLFDLQQPGGPSEPTKDSAPAASQPEAARREPVTEEAGAEKAAGTEAEVAEPAPTPAAAEPSLDLGAGGSLFDLQAPEPAKAESAPPAETTSSADAAQATEATKSVEADVVESSDSAASADGGAAPAPADAAEATKDVEADVVESSDSAESADGEAISTVTPARSPAEAAAPSSTEAPAPKLDLGSGGSLFDIAAPAVAAATTSTPAPSAEPAPEPASAAGEHEPATAGGAALSAAATATASDEPADSAVAAAPASEESEAELVDAEEDAATETAPESTSAETKPEEPAPEPTSSGPSHQPRTDADISGSSSLFDL